MQDFFVFLQICFFSKINVVKIYEENPNPIKIRHVVEVLRNKGVIIIPTDTVYAFACDIFNASGIETISKLKNKDNKSNLSFICHQMSQVSEYARMDDTAFKLMKKNLPGPFTFILQGSNSLPKLFKNRKNVGIRIPDNNITLEIVRELGHPIMTSSIPMNDRTEEYFTDPELIHEMYDNRVDLVIDGGFGGIIHSTVIDCTGEEPELVRQGAGELKY
ncbi:MAG: L-threonylcarbamoyladenylate synthase [Paludibacteraceae bacterium]|nr:threonylcarbamoyl-AMP synthase [Bacteroidia bacterium]